MDAPSCLTSAGRAYFATPTFSRPGESNAARSGGIHHDRHAATAGPPPASTHTSFAPPRPRLLALVAPPPPRARSSCISRRRRAERAETSVAAAVHTESSRIAANVSESTSGRIARRFLAPSLGTSVARGTYRPLLDASFARRRAAASDKKRRASSGDADAPVLASTISSNAACTSFTVCDRGSSQLDHKMRSTRDVNSSESAPAVASSGSSSASSASSPSPSAGAGRASPGSPSAAAAARASAAARTRASAAFKAADA